jgi:hypothetical protein
MSVNNSSEKNPAGDALHWHHLRDFMVVSFVHQAFSRLFIASSV